MLSEKQNPINKMKMDIKPSRAETPLGMGGNIYQTFRFTIPLDEARKRASQ